MSPSQGYFGGESVMGFLRGNDGDFLLVSNTDGGVSLCLTCPASGNYGNCETARGMQLDLASHRLFADHRTYVGCHGKSKVACVLGAIENIARVRFAFARHPSGIMTLYAWQAMPLGKT